MSAMVRLIVCASALAAAFFGLELGHPGWVRELAPALTSLYELQVLLDQEHQRTDDLEATLTRVVARVQVRRQVGVDLIAGRLTLAEAAARFQETGQELSAQERAAFRDAYPGRCDEERYWRQAIAAAASELPARPWEAATVLARLNAELQQELDCGRLSTAGREPDL